MNIFTSLFNMAKERAELLCVTNKITDLIFVLLLLNSDWTEKEVRWELLEYDIEEIKQVGIS